MNTDLIKQGYNSAAAKYLAERGLLRSTKYVEKLLRKLKPNSSVLDLGCGAGAPVDDALLKAGHQVTGIDISEEMIRWAKLNCRGGNFSVGDIAELTKGQFAADAVISFYALFHLPKGRHGEILKVMRSFLTPGGILLVTMGDKDFEGYTNFYGTRMWWSQWGPVKNNELVEKAGFEIELNEIDTTGSERHQIIMATAI